MGGGRSYFLKANESGKRIDNRDLIKEWKEKMNTNNLKAKYVTNLTDFRQLKPRGYDHLLGKQKFVKSPKSHIFCHLFY